MRVLETPNHRPSDAGLPGSKLTPRHRERLAIVYIRQSTLQQTIRNQESTRLQYALVERAQELGFCSESIVVIDDDLGRSGKSAEGRPGFQRLVAEVGLGHVGVILGIEMSRLARSCRDWHQLLEVCALFGTLLCDQDGIYDPAQYNDRLLLGLKGTLSEAELHILKQRMLQGKLQKARRGELGAQLPIGYVRRPSGEVVKDPDEQVQTVVALVFEQFAAKGTLHSVLRYLVDNGIRIPIRCRSGVNKGDLQWQRPNRCTLTGLLRHPSYAGVYVYGRRRVDPRRQKPGRPATGRTVTPKEQWEAFVPGRWPAYISLTQYEANQEQLLRNQARARGTVRRGPALLSGLLFCGRCGHKMATSYNSGKVQYACASDSVNYGGARCQSLSGGLLDQRVSQLVLLALEPSALEVSLSVAQDIQAERTRLEVAWQKQLERAKLDVDRALRQYNTVEPENRLVARTLEQQLEQQLQRQKSLSQEYARVMAQQPTALFEEELEAIRRLAADIPSLWEAATTTVVDRQQIIRQLVDKIFITVLGHSEKVEVLVHWVGGHQTQTTAVRPVARLQQLSYYPELRKRVESLRHSGLKLKQIAKQLNDEGFCPPKRRTTWNEEMVTNVLTHGCALQVPESTTSSQKASSEKEPKTRWPLAELARYLEMPDITLYSWLRRGWVKAERVEGPRKRWIIEADPQELSRLRALKHRKKHGSWYSSTRKEPIPTA